MVGKTNAGSNLEKNFVVVDTLEDYVNNYLTKRPATIDFCSFIKLEKLDDKNYTVYCPMIEGVNYSSELEKELPEESVRYSLYGFISRGLGAVSFQLDVSQYDINYFWDIGEPAPEIPDGWKVQFILFPDGPSEFIKQTFGD